jgi:catechol 2,3-dioxygenase-like lactoylglutathione lyase family enzyme
MSLVRLDHINISTTQPAETRDFFIKVLDLKEGWRPDFAFPGHWLYLGEQAVVHIVGRPQQRLPSDDSALDHFAFIIDDYEAAVERLDRHGIAYNAIGVPGTGTRQLFLRDPNGVTIELNCPASET